MKSVTVWIDPQTRMVAIKTADYDQYFNSTLKLVCKGYYRWDPARKIWLVDQVVLDKLEGMFKQLNYNMIDGTLPQEAPSNGHSPFHDLISDLPITTLQKIYHVIALEHHPDKGGSEALMTKVNVAWSEIRREKR